MSRHLKLTIPRQLKSPNAWNGRHWRYKHKESQDWQMDIAWSLLTPEGQKGGIFPLLLAANAIPVARLVCADRRKVTITRLAPSARNFIRDDDNLRFAVKPVNDALKRLGLIRDDNRKWLDQPMPTQEVSPTGHWSTVIEIEASVEI